MGVLEKWRVIEQAVEGEIFEFLQRISGTNICTNNQGNIVVKACESFSKEYRSQPSLSFSMKPRFWNI
jgi:hypothetical protein